MPRLITAVALLIVTMPLAAQTSSKPNVESIYPDLEKLYIDLHQTPELSRHEEKTAAKMAARLKQLG